MRECERKRHRRSVCAIDSEYDILHVIMQNTEKKVAAAACAAEKQKQKGPVAGFSSVMGPEFLAQEQVEKLAAKTPVIGLIPHGKIHPGLFLDDAHALSSNLQPYNKTVPTEE